MNPEPRLWTPGFRLLALQWLFVQRHLEVKRQLMLRERPLATALAQTQLQM